MKFTINSNDLLQRCNMLAKAQASKTSLSILECICLELSDGNIRLTSSDSNITLTTKLPVTNVEGVGESVCILTSTLISALRELANQPVTFSIDTKTFGIHIEYLGGVFNFTGNDAGEYPHLPENDDNHTIIGIPVKAVTTGLSTVVRSTANDELRPIMNGVCFDFTAEGLVLVASNGYKLARMQYNDIITETPQCFVLPTKASDILSAIAAKQSTDIEVEFDNRHAVFTTDNYTLDTTLLEGQFPNYDAVIPKNQPIQVRIERNTLISALRRVLVFADETTSLVSFHVEHDKIILAGQDTVFGQSGEESVPCDSNCDDLNIGFKGEFLLELLRTIYGNEMIITLSDATHAGVFYPSEQTENENYLVLLMPMNLGDK